ncbi:3'-5' exonuclease [Clostridium perfringens]
MVASKKVINKKYIKDYVYNNLWMLNKEDIQYLLREYDIEYKSKETKNVLLGRLKSTKGINYWDVYKEYQITFSISLWDLQELLNIDSKMRKKLTDKGYLVVNRWEEKKATFGKYDAPFYDLETLYKMDITKLEELKEKYKPKERTQKQKEGAIRAAETRARRKEEEYKRKLEKVTKDTTCVICKEPTMDYNLINWEGICTSCCREIQQEKDRKSAILEGKKIMKNKDNIAILDMETTNLDFDDICSISIIDANYNILMDTLVKPVGNIDMGATYAHRVSNADVVDAPTIQELLPKLIEIFNKYDKIYYYNIGYFCLKRCFKKLDIKIDEFIDGNKFERLEAIIEAFGGDGDSEYSHAVGKYVSSIPFNKKIDIDTAEYKELKLRNRSLKDCCCVMNFLKISEETKL